MKYTTSSCFCQVFTKFLQDIGVIDEIGEAGELFDDILVLKPESEELENRIGNLVYEAYDKRDKANQLEDGVVNLLENKLRELA